MSAAAIALDTLDLRALERRPKSAQFPELTEVMDAAYHAVDEHWYDLPPSLQAKLRALPDMMRGRVAPRGPWARLRVRLVGAYWMLRLGPERTVSFMHQAQRLVDAVERKMAAEQAWYDVRHAAVAGDADLAREVDEAYQALERGEGLTAEQVSAALADLDG